jgi:hypothetical protein
LSTADHHTVGIHPRVNIGSARWVRFRSAPTLWVSAPFALAGEAKPTPTSARNLLPVLVQWEIDRALLWSDLFVVDENGRVLKYGLQAGRDKRTCPGALNYPEPYVYQREPEELEYVAGKAETKRIADREQDWARKANVPYPGFGKPYPPWADQFKIADQCAYRVERSRAAYLALASKVSKDAAKDIHTALALVDNGLRRREPLCFAIVTGSTPVCVKPRTSPWGPDAATHELVAAPTNAERLKRVSQLAAFVALSRAATVLVEPQHGDYIVESPLVKDARTRLATDGVQILAGLERAAAAARARAEAEEKKRVEIERRRAALVERARQGRMHGDK